MAIMYDGVNVATVPAGAQVYAGYVDGRYENYEQMVAKFPNAQHVKICVASSYQGDAQVLDVEEGDSTAQHAIGWITRQRARGIARPTIYCSRLGDGVATGWQAVKDAVAAAGIDPPDYWIADYTGASHGLPGAVAVQWIDRQDLYDESLVTDASWPGGAAEHPKPAGGGAHTSPPATSGGDRPYVVQDGDTLSEIAASTGSTVKAISERNGIENPDLIHAGQVLTIPG